MTVLHAEPITPVIPNTTKLRRSRGSLYPPSVGIESKITTMDRHGFTTNHRLDAVGSTVATPRGTRGTVHRVVQSPV